MASGPITLASVLYRTLIAAAFVWVALPATADDQVRVALVLGNSEYEHVSKLPNPASDAQDIGAAFERIGFSVTTGFNLDYNQMRLVLRDFAEDAADADVVIIYFAGHGIEIDNTNYLIPVNAQLKSDRDIDFEAIRLDTIVDAIADAPGLKIVLVDACRNNPFLVDMARTSASRNVGRGLGRIDPSGVLVGYAARGGTIALDGQGRNSPYAQALLKHLEEPGLEIGKLFRKVRDTVVELTDGAQEPFTYGSLPGEDIYLVSAPAMSAVALGTAQSQSGATPGNDLCEQATLAWSLIFDTENRSMIERFSERFQHCPLATQAAATRLSEIDKHLQKQMQPNKNLLEVVGGDTLSSPKGDNAPPLQSERVTEDNYGAEADDCRRMADYEEINSRALKSNLEQALAICSSAFAYNPEDARISAALARAYSLGGDHFRGFKYWRIAADLGYAPAMAELGLAYEMGSGTEADLAKSEELYRRAAEAGSVMGMLNLGFAIEQRFTGKSDASEALFWYKKAANAKEKPFENHLRRAAMNNVGAMYEHGVGTERSMTDAFKWYSRSAELGDAVGMTNLALLYEKGAGTERDMTEAEKWYTRAANEGDGIAMGQLALLMAQRSESDPEAVVNLMLRCMEVDEQCVNQIDHRLPLVKRPFVLALQETLKQRGYFNGSIDGVADDEVILAMRKFSSEN